MSLKSQTRWHHPGISADHRPGTGRHKTSYADFSDPPEKEPDTIPPAIQLMILTGEGFNWRLPPADPCGYPKRAYYTPEEMEAESKPSRKLCLTPYCKSTIETKRNRDYCFTCTQKRAALKAHGRYAKKSKKESVKC